MAQFYWRRRENGLKLVCALLVVFVGVSLWTPPVRAELPPRPPVNGDSDDNGEAIVLPPDTAQINLYVRPADGRYWAVVQWQDTGGGWHDVSGWRGDVDGGRVMWWVAEKDFGTGPFRWVVYREGGPVIDRGDDTFIGLGDRALLAASAPFDLPEEGKSLSVHVNIGGPTTPVPAEPEYGLPRPGYGAPMPVNKYRQPNFPNQNQRYDPPRYLPNQNQHYYPPRYLPNQGQRYYPPRYLPNQNQRNYQPRYVPYRGPRYGP